MADTESGGGSFQNDPLKKSIVVVGGGSAGFLAAITLKARMPVLDVTVVHSSDIPIIGVGEGTTLTMPIFLHGYLGIDPHRFHREVKPTYKLGIRFLWGPRERFFYTFSTQLDKFLQGMPRPNGFFAFEDFEYADVAGALAAHGKGFQEQEGGGPVVNTDLAYHIENVPFVQFLEKYAEEIGVNIQDDKILEVEQDENGVSGLQLASGERKTGDLYIDCSGFASIMLGEAMGEPLESYQSSLFCDRAIIGGWTRRGNEPLLPYTTAETMDSGWAWQIEHDDFINRGYVFSSNFISDNDAEEEFRKKNSNVKETRTISFSSGARKKTWIKNVVALGNSAGFVEPLEATALAVICEHAAKLIHCLADSYLEIDPKSRDYYNRYCNRTWQDIRRFLALHYKFNTRIETDFWKACWNDTNLTGAEDIIEYYDACGPSLLWGNAAMGPDDPFTWEGYLVMMVGQKVPFRRPYAINPEEEKVWKDYQARLRDLAGNGLTMREGLDMIRSDRWKWKPDFYQNAARW